MEKLIVSDVTVLRQSLLHLEEMKKNSIVVPQQMNHVDTNSVDLNGVRMNWTVHLTDASAWRPNKESQLTIGKDFHGKLRLLY